MDNRATTEPKTTEQLILEAAEREFATKGIDGARTSSIATEAGVTHAMLHYYFRTKEQLFQRVVSEKMQNILAIVATPLVGGHGPLKERILDAASRHFDFIAANRTLPVFLVTIIHSRPELLREAIAGVKEIAAHREALQHELDAAAERGEISPMKIEDLIGDIVSLNAFPFLTMPMMMTLLGITDETEFLNNRKREIIETITRRIS